MNKQVIQLNMTFVSQFMHLTLHFYALYYTFVLGNCTQVHLQCTWVVPKYISQNPVLVLKHF